MIYQDKIKTFFENGKITAVRDVCTINIRIAREIKGAADDIYKSVFMC